MVCTTNLLLELFRENLFSMLLDYEKGGQEQTHQIRSTILPVDIFRDVGFAKKKKIIINTFIVFNFIP